MLYSRWLGNRALTFSPTSPGRFSLIVAVQSGTKRYIAVQSGTKRYKAVQSGT